MGKSFVNIPRHTENASDSQTSVASMGLAAVPGGLTAPSGDPNSSDYTFVSGVAGLIQDEVADSFEVTDLVRLFRSGLLVLLPVMDAARIRWTKPGVYDPLEDIERTLYASIVGNCVENAEPDGLLPLAAYGLAQVAYAYHSFVSERGLRLEGTINVLVELQVGKKPFDTALLHELDAGLVPTGRAITKQIETCAFDLAARSAHGFSYRAAITCAK